MDMLFLQANAKLPRGEVTSTARKGDKWSKQTKPGDVLDLKVTETGALIGRGAVILVEQQTFASVIRKAYQNHAAKATFVTLEAEREAVKASLRAAYGDAKDEDVYTVVHFLVLNDEPRYADGAATMKQHGLGNHAAVVPRVTVGAAARAMEAFGK